MFTNFICLHFGLIVLHTYKSMLVLPSKLFHSFNLTLTITSNHQSMIFCYKTVSTIFFAFIYIFFNVLDDILHIKNYFVNTFQQNNYKTSFGGLKWNRTIDLTLIRRAL